MSDEYDEKVAPVGSGGRIDGLGGHSEPGRPAHAPHSIVGRVIAVRTARTPHDGQHKLDVTVGGSDATEIVLRVSKPPAMKIEGKRAVLYIDE